MKTPELNSVRRRSWLGFLCLSTLLSACGGGGGDAHWDSALSAWDSMTWN